MFRKTLTHFIILMLTVLPVQVISASVENNSMYMSMQKSAQMDTECVHMSTLKLPGVKTGQNNMDKSCCDDSSQHCQSCNDCTQAYSSSMFLAFNQFIKPLPLSKDSYFTNYLVLSGVPQQNIQKPPLPFI